MKLPLCLPTSQKLKVRGRFLSTGEALKERSQPAEQGIRLGRGWTGAPTCAREECPFLSREPVRRLSDDFLAEGPIGPRLPLLLVPISWDTATLEPTHA